MSKWIRIICAVLVLMMLVSVFAACGSSSDGKTETKGNETKGSDKPGDKTDETETEEEKDAFDRFLDGYTANYQNREFTIAVFPDDSSLIWGDVDWLADTMNGDTINDAVYTRNAMVSENLGIEIIPIPQTEYASITNITTGIAAGNKDYNALNITIKNAFTAAQNDYLHELHDFGSIDLEETWWDPNVINDMSIAHKNYILTGDIGTMYKKSIAVIMFNKVLLNDIDYQSVGHPYDLMADKAWTIDAMVELGSMVSADVNSDERYDENDKYGLIYFCNMAGSAMIGCGVDYTTKDEDDIPALSFYSETTVDILEGLADLLYDKTTAWSWNANGKQEDTAFAMFKSDQSLFYYGELHAVATMRSMQSEFGILPMPMFDDMQKAYHHTINPDVAAVICVPKDIDENEFTGTVLDALGAASKVVLTPAYYDVNLYTKTTRDEQSRATLDIVINTINYDVGLLAIPDISDMLKSLVNAYSRDLASTWSKQEPVFQGALDEIVESFEG